MRRLTNKPRMQAGHPNPAWFQKSIDIGIIGHHLTDDEVQDGHVTPSFGHRRVKVKHGDCMEAEAKIATQGHDGVLVQHGSVTLYESSLILRHGECIGLHDIHDLCAAVHPQPTVTTLSTAYFQYMVGVWMQVPHAKGTCASETGNVP